MDHNIAWIAGFPECVKICVKKCFQVKVFDIQSRNFVYINLR